MRIPWRLIAIVCVGLAVPVLRAQEAEHAAGHAEEAKPALLTYDPGAAIWSIIVFVLLLVLLRATAWKPILRVLQEREEFIRKSIDEAKAEREQATKLLAEHEARLRKAQDEATAIVAEGRRDAEVARQRIHEQARQESEELVARARRDIQLATDAAIKELYDQTADLSVRIAGRILDRELKAADHRQLVAESLKEMQANRPGPMN